MAIDATEPLLRFLVTPLDGSASFRSPWCLHESMAGLFRGGSDGGQDGGSGNFSVQQFQSQNAFDSISGSLNFVRFQEDGVAAFGVNAAVASKPGTEVCGLTGQLRVEQLQNRMDNDAATAPASPAGAPVLLWHPEQGSGWETVLPAKSPLVTAVRHRPAPANRTVKIRTVLPWLANQGFTADFDLGGIPSTHTGAAAAGQPATGEAAYRLSWGDKYSLVVRGQGAGVHAQIEKRVSGAWSLLRALDKSPAVDAQSWSAKHTLRVQRLGGRLVVTWDNTAYWLSEFETVGGELRPVPLSWPKAPLRLSVVGAAFNLQVSRLTGLDAAGKPVVGKFSRSVPAPERPFDSVSMPFDIRRNLTQRSGEVTARMVGSGLDGVQITGGWNNETAFYQATLTCTETEAPLLCSFAVNFPPPALGAPPAPIDLFHAISNWSVDSGDPEVLPDAQAQFTLSRSQLEKLIPNWETAVLPYRPLLIQAKYPSQENWTTLFDGFLTPESASRGGWNDYELPIEARGQLLKLMQPYALIDERFQPLDLLLNEDKQNLYGAEAVKGLLAAQLGETAVANFNGTGQAMQYFSQHYPLLSTEQAGYFTATQNLSQNGSFQLPPPYGEYLKSWIDSIAKFDHAAWFYDSTDRAFYYGRIVEFLAERGDTLWTVTEDAPPSDIRTSQEWPLLTSMAASGLLADVYNDIRVWSAPAPGMEQFAPALLMGRAGEADPASLDPLSVVQSGRRSLVVKNDILKVGLVDANYVQDLAYSIWNGYRGVKPKRVDLQFDTGFLGPRWGELLHLTTGFEGPEHGGAPEDLRILQVKHKGSMAGSGNRFETMITAATLSGDAQ